MYSYIFAYKDPHLLMLVTSMSIPQMRDHSFHRSLLVIYFQMFDFQSKVLFIVGVSASVFSALAFPLIGIQFGAWIDVLAPMPYAVSIDRTQAIRG